MRRTKTQFRQQIKQRKALLSIKERAIRSHALFERMEALPLFQAAHRIICFNALPDEPDTEAFLTRNATTKGIYLPIVCGESLRFAAYTGKASLRKGAFGIFEPVGPQVDSSDLAVDLILVPGVAFDINLNRLGRGKGYYDRLLTQVKAHKLGVCYDFQLVDQVPTEPFDISMDSVLTEARYQLSPRL